MPPAGNGPGILFVALRPDEASAKSRSIGSTVRRVDRLAAVARFREIDASPGGLAELSRFYRRAYVREFPDPDERESLANMKRYLRLKAQGWYGRNNYHIVLAELDGEPIGGSVVDYLAEPNAG